MSLCVLNPGPLTTVQDLGREGCAAEGFRRCGAADSYVGLAFTELDDIIDYIKEHSVVTAADTEIGRR